MIKKVIAICIMPVLLFGCENDIDSRIMNFFTGKDNVSPQLVDVIPVDSTTILFTFDEFVFRPYISLDKQYKGSTCRVSENNLIVQLTYPLDVMRETKVYLTVRDFMNNSTTIEVPVYGINHRVPELIINEFTTKGSSAHPDRVELKVLSNGNLAGVTLYQGLFFNHSHAFSFPSIEVKKGDYVVVQYQQIVEEKPLLFYGGADGLGGNNGIISLYNSPYDDIKDVVLYSNRTSDSDESYGGFGTREVYDQVLELTCTNEWTHAGVIIPENAINSELSTATRSCNRKEGESDTNTKNDWYITETSGATFGNENNTVIYSP